MNANSPHRATSGWAKTSVRFNWGGDPVYATSDDVITATVARPTVTKTARVDMPHWAPTDPAMRSAWAAMISSLRAHEAVHEEIATTWEETLRTSLAGLTVTVPNRTIGAFRAAVQAEWDMWLAQHQDEQDSIDPYTALLDCSGGESEDGSGSGAPGEGVEDEPDLGGE